MNDGFGQFCQKRAFDAQQTFMAGSAPDQAERDAAIRKRFYADALAEIRANPERYYAVLEMKERGEEWPDEKCCRA